MLTLAPTDYQSCLGTLYVLQDNDTQKQTKQTTKQTYTTNHTETNQYNKPHNKQTYTPVAATARKTTNAAAVLPAVTMIYCMQYF
jgi:GH43 family beta-xylosidase